MRRKFMTVVILTGLLLAAAPFVFQAAAMDEDMFLGRPEFKEGRDLGYYVWREGDLWHVRWTTFGARRHFTGHVLALGGKIFDLNRIDVEVERKVIRPGLPPRVVRGPRGRAHVVRGRPPVVKTRAEDHIRMENEQKIVFSCFTDDDVDGFNFRVGPGAETLRFLLEIDGKSKPEYVEVGKANITPELDPFNARLK